MVAVDEFELGAQAGPPALAGASRRRRSGRPDVWVAVALVLGVIGVLAVPPTLPRPSAVVPGWGGLTSVVYAQVDEDVTDAVAFAQGIVRRGVVHDGDGNRLGAVILLIRAAAEPPGMSWESTPSLAGVTLDSRLLTALEDTGAQSDWVCDTAAGHVTCTTLSGPRHTLDWPAV